MKLSRKHLASVAIYAASIALNLSAARAAETSAPSAAAVVRIPSSVTKFNTAKVGELDIFYREAGDPKNPTVLLLHGFPTSSHMFRNLIPQLAEQYHVVAPDMPGFGYSSMPDRSTFTYSFDNLAEVIDSLTVQLKLDSYSIYVMDYGAPIGWRLALKHPEKITAIVAQNGNAYDEGLREVWDPFRAYWADPQNPEKRAALAGFLKIDATKWQYTAGTRNPAAISPDTWTLDQMLLDRPGNNEIQLDLFYDYRNNPPLYPKVHEFFRKEQPPTLIVWGRNDPIFPTEGATAFLRDLPNAEFHLLNTGHFALEEDAATIGSLMVDFLDRNVER